MAIQYEMPTRWIHYNLADLVEELADAKGAIRALKSIPYQRRWVDELQEMQLKLEVAGTSKIEGADFAGDELEKAMRETPEQLLTRSQKQAHAAMQSYRWLASLPIDQPITSELILNLHRRIVTGADDDHCDPGSLRGADHNVVFGVPPHRGCVGGEECKRAMALLLAAIENGFRQHDPLIQAFAAHYHLAAMHPFMDGNGRTARALEAFMLRRAGLRDTVMIPMSNYYYDEKKTYLTTLAQVRAKDYDLTPFLRFALRGLAIQSQRLADAIRVHTSKVLYRGLMYDLFNRLQNRRKRVIMKRQIEVMEYLLARDEVDWSQLVSDIWPKYGGVGNPQKALLRDVNHLLGLGAIVYRKEEDGDRLRYFFRPRLEWPTEITETEFFKRVSELPRAKIQYFKTA